MTSYFYPSSSTYIRKSIITCIGTFLLLLNMPLTGHAQQYKILTIGNSITHGSIEEPSYRYPLYEKLTRAYIDFSYIGSMTSESRQGQNPASCLETRLTIPVIAHEGHSGWRTDHILNGLPSSDPGKLSDWLQTYTPDVVLMHIGTNDMLQNRSVARTIEVLREIVRVLRLDNPQVTILMAKLIPADPASVGSVQANNITLFNNEIPALVQELNSTQSRVYLVDQNTGFNPTPGADTYDGLHTNTRGSLKMANKWFQTLSGILQPYTQQPSVSISTPVAGATYTSGTTMKIAANASDPEGALRVVEFFANCTKIGEDATSPYEINWTPSGTSNITLRARAKDAAGAIRISASVVISNAGSTGFTLQDIPDIVIGAGIPFELFIPIDKGASNVIAEAGFQGSKPVWMNAAKTTTGDAVRLWGTPPSSGWGTYTPTVYAKTISGAQDTELLNIRVGNCTNKQWYSDVDGDGWGAKVGLLSACWQPSGYIRQGGDCNDRDAAINPAAQEIPGDGKDNNCDGQLDGGGGGTAFALEQVPAIVIGSGRPFELIVGIKDGADFTLASASLTGSKPSWMTIEKTATGKAVRLWGTPPASGYGTYTPTLTAKTTTAAEHSQPLSIRVGNCNNKTWYLDKDGDGWGNSTTATQLSACWQPSGYVTKSGDCNDGDAAINPGSTEIPGDGKDNNCDGKTDANATTSTRIASTSAASDADTMVGLSFFPNPVAERLTIQLPSPTQKSVDVKVYSLHGALVHKKSFQPALETTVMELDMHMLSKGVYLIRIQTEKQQHAFKIIKE